MFLMKKVPPYFLHANGPAFALRLFLVVFFCTVLASARAFAADNPPVFSADDSAALIEQEGNLITVRGTISRVGETDDQTITFLNFGPRAADRFVAVIFARDMDKFPEGFAHLTGQVVEVTGNLEMFRNQQPQIRVETPEQLRVVEN